MTHSPSLCFIHNYSHSWSIYSNHIDFLVIPGTWPDTLPHLGFCTCCFLCSRTFFLQIINKFCFLFSLVYVKPFNEVSNIISHFVSHYFSIPSPCLLLFQYIYLTSSVLSYLYSVCFPHKNVSFQGRDSCFVSSLFCPTPRAVSITLKLLKKCEWNLPGKRKIIPK